MKIVIIGSKGMAGHMLYHYLKSNTDFEIIDIARGSDSHLPSHQMDVSDFKALEKVLESENPSVVINCIGVLNQDAETHPEKAILLNSYFPHFLARVGNKLDYKLVHISTDCVFNGKKGGYAEQSEKDGFGFYANTKALGEVNYGQHLTLRTSIIGPELKSNGIGLFHWFMSQKGRIRGYTKAFWSGVTTLELAKGIVEAIKQDIVGLHHFTNGVKINKYDLTKLFKEVFHKEDIQIEAYSGYQVDKSLVKTNFDFTYEVRSYQKMIEEMKNWMDQHPELYQANYLNT